MSKDKPISHWQRRNYPACRPQPIEVNRPVEGRLFITDEIDPETNRIRRVSSFNSIDRVKEMENYRCADFSLENMLSVGVDIQPMKMSTSGFSTLDNLEVQVSKIRNNIKSQIQNNE